MTERNTQQPELEALRRELDALDAELVALIERRMALAERIGQCKARSGLPVLDAAREEQVLASRAGLAKRPENAETIRALYRCLMAQSRLRQEDLQGRRSEC